MNLWEMLDELKCRAKDDPELYERLIKTRQEEKPLSSFCEICRQSGYELYEMDLLCAGEEFYAAMKRSTNGGGENSPVLKGEDDFYEMFFADLQIIKNNE